MVESNANGGAIVTANPSVTRGMRVRLACNGTHWFYACKNNVIARSMANEMADSFVYTEIQDKVTAVVLAPDNERLGVGTETGRFCVLRWTGKKLALVKDHECKLSGAIRAVVWPQQGPNVVVLGESKGTGSCFDSETGSQRGDVTGFLDTVLCGFMTKAKVMYTAGQMKEILRHEMPFKAPPTKVEHPHTNFVNQMKMSPDGSKFVTVSSDKSICVFETETATKIKHWDKAHAMGIYDVDWIDDNSFITCSADNLVRTWQMD